MNFVELYVLLVILPGIDDAFNVVAVLSLVGFVVATALFLVLTTAEDLWTDQDWTRGARKWGIRVASVCFLFTAIAIVSPSEEQLQKIIGGYVVTNIEGIEQLPENLVDYANKFLEGESQEDEQ